MPRINNFAITRQFPGGRNESEKITVFVQLEEGDQPGDIFKEVHSLVMDLNPFGPWSPEDVEGATHALARAARAGTEGVTQVDLNAEHAKRVLADHDEWGRSRCAAVERLNQLGGTMDSSPKPIPPPGTVAPPIVRA